MFKRALTLAVASSVGLGLAAHAQTADTQVESADASEQASGQQADTPSRLGTVLVTAQRRSESLADVPLSITTASGAELAARGITSTDGLERLAPGFTYQRSSYGVPIFSIRGVGFLDTALGVPPTVTIYVDQVPMAYSAMAAGAALDIERVEILKGPQGTLYGQNSTGGLVNYIAAKPTDEFHAGGSFTAGRFAQADIEGYLSGPITDTLKARLAVRTEQRGDWQENYTRDDTLGSRDFTTGRFLLDWDPTADASVELGLTGWVDKSDTQAAQYFGYQPTANPPQIPEPEQILLNYPLAPRDPRAADWNPDLDNRLHNDNSFYQAYVRGSFQPWGDSTTLSVISTFSRFDANFVVDSDGVTNSSLELAKSGRLQSFFNEARLSGEVGERLQWMFGGSLQSDKIFDNEVVLPPFISSNSMPLPFFPRITSLRNNNTQEVDTQAIFGSLDYDLTDSLTLQGSVRYTNEDREFIGCSYDTNGSVYQIVNFLGSLVGVPENAVAGGCFTFDVDNAERLDVYHIPLEEDNVSWRTSLNWKPTEDSLLYANVTKGFKGGSFPTLTATTIQEFTPATQEELLAYEAGFRTELFNGSAQVSGAAFRYEYDDKQVLGIFQTIFGNLPRLTNIPKSEVNGAELQLLLAPTDQLKINLGGTYVKSKVTDHFSNLSNPLGQTVDIYGESFPNSPEWQLTGDVQYDFHISSTLDGFVGGGAYYRSSAQAGFGRVPEFVIPSYTLLDLRAGIVSADGWRAEIWGHNVTDELYWNNIAKLTDTFSRTTGMPRTYGVRLSYDF
ncbi:MAG: TonB-dependent receptor [Hyphomonas sp.]